LFNNVTEKSLQNVQKRKVIDSTAEAWDHYRNGSGEAVELGPNTKLALRNHPIVRRQLGALKNGTANHRNGNLGVDLTSEVFHVGDTGVVFSTNCSQSLCTTTFTGFIRAEVGTSNIIGADGFWDVLGGNDTLGPNGEILGGKPYSYIPYEWAEKYPNKFGN